MTSKRKVVAAVIFLLALHLAILLAGFISPYQPATQNRDFPYLPPTHLHFVDARGHLHFRPFIYQSVARPDSLYEYTEDREHAYPVHFFVSGFEYKIAGWFPSRTHWFGVDAPAQIFLAGTDGYGRDQFSRILFGGQISLAAGLLATVISLLLGLCVGCASGFYGGWIDESAMRLAELFLVLPWLYVLLAVRAFLPLHISPAQTFLLLVAVIGTIGWARPARLVRGIVLSAKSRKYVTASRGFGASDAYILRRHVLPHTYGTLLTQAAVLVPQYVIAEVTLSFFGLGLSEPMPSWGNLLANLQQYNVLVSYWWMFAPALALVLISLGYLAVANAFQQRLQSGSI
ncbi:MAG TPA: ABC transporter permease [Candidatus Sulfotelmatobacter sp.]|nr:ABC transporter permease [Candidatus Sulfotelmatobacter sp.]